MNKYQKETLAVMAKFPTDLAKALVSKKFYVALCKFLTDLAKVITLIALGFMLLGQVTQLGHGDQEYQNQHQRTEWLG
jgi:hypothetical protein